MSITVILQFYKSVNYNC